MKTITTSTTQKLFVLNELAKKIDLNLFNRFIAFDDIETVNLYADYNFDLYDLLKDKFGLPKTYVHPFEIQLIFSTETIQIILTLKNL
jgi:hypothetical protein